MKASFVCSLFIATIIFSDCNGGKNAKNSSGSKHDTSYLSGEDSVIIKEGDTIIMDLSDTRLLPIR